ncbi:hypothetical protein FBULB1_5478 [Fusarium bulbicola]|nr:hypothetical protein FBULB1_5478 [Fusarium bulbicola]
MCCFPAVRVICQNLNCLSSSGQTHDAPKLTWSLDSRNERQGKPALTKGKILPHPSTEYPEVPDPACYAIIAVLTHYLAVTFSRLINRGLPWCCSTIIASAEAEAELRARKVVLEVQPPWAKAVRRLDEPITIPASSSEKPEDRFRSAEFLAVNIIAAEPHVAFV